jgi:membrane-associated phospholipid phosphatase
MESVLLWGLELIRSVQSHASPALTACMKLITHLGAAPVYLVILPLIYWCFDEKKGLRLSLAVLVSLWINMALKQFLGQPRPFWEGWDPSVGMIGESLNGFPSGHAQISLIMWTIIASWTGKKWALPAACFLSLLVGFSRLYLGVHFPTDLLGGWILGALGLPAYLLREDRLKDALIRGGPRLQRILCAGLAFVMILYRPRPELLIPGALVLGLGLGYSLNLDRLRFRAAGDGGDGPGPSGNTEQSGNAEQSPGAQAAFRGLRFAAGMAGMALLFTLLGRLIPEESAALYPLLFFFRFALLGFWMSFAAPWLFLRLGLARGAEAPVSPGP